LQETRRDPIADIDEKKAPTGLIQPDGNGYERYIPATPEDKAALEAYLGEELDQGEKDYRPVWDRMLANRKVFHAKSERDEIITIPIAKRDALHLIARLYNQIVKQQPMVSVSPDEPGMYEVLEQDSATGLPTTQALTSEEIAKGLEDLLQFKFTKRLPFKKTIYTLLTDMITGESPSFLKVSYAREMVPVRQRVVKNGMLETEIREVAKGEAAKLSHVSGYNMLLPADAMDTEEAPWVAERLPRIDTATLRQRISSGEYNLAPDGDELKSLLSSVSDVYGSSYAKQLGEISGRLASGPQGTHDIWEVWFYYPAVIEEMVPVQDGLEPLPEGGEPRQETRLKVEILSLCGTYHRAARKLLNCYLNPYWHGRRPYFPFFQRQTAHQFSGESTVEDVAPFQRLVSHIYHSQLANAAQANIVALKIRKNSSAWQQMVVNKTKLRPGLVIGVDDMDDVMPFRTGENFYSMNAELGLLFSESAKMSTVSEASRGMAPLSRTPFSTLTSSIEAGDVQNVMVLDLFRTQMSAALTAYVQVLQQYSPYGERIPFRDPKTRNAIQKIISFPREAIVGQFGFTITASAEDQSKEQEFQRDMMLYNTAVGNIHEFAQLAGMALQPGVPPPIAQIYFQLLKVLQQALSNVVSHGRKDAEKYVVDPEAVQLALQQMQQAMAQMQMAQQGMQPQLPPGDPGMSTNVPEMSTPPMEMSPEMMGGMTPEMMQELMGGAIGG
jgi:hypothetical protein